MIKSLQHLKALQRAPQGTLAFRFYLPTDNKVVLHIQAFDGFAGIIVNHLIKPHIIEEAVYA